MILRTREEVMEEVWNTLDHAERKHPTWPMTDRLRQAAIVMEEAGELMRSMLNLIEHREKKLMHGTAGEYQAYMSRGRGIEDEILNEAAQTAAMAIRLLQSYARVYTPVSNGQTADARTYPEIEHLDTGS